MDIREQGDSPAQTPACPPSRRCVQQGGDSHWRFPRGTIRRAHAEAPRQVDLTQDEPRDPERRRPCPTRTSRRHGATRPPATRRTVLAPRSSKAALCMGAPPLQSAQSSTHLQGRADVLRRRRPSVRWYSSASPMFSSMNPDCTSGWQFAVQRKRRYLKSFPEASLTQSRQW